MSELVLNFDPQITRVLSEYYNEVVDVLERLTNDDTMDENVKEFMIRNTMEHKAHFDRILLQVYRERTE